MPHATTKDGVKIAYTDAGRSDTAWLCMPGWCIDRSVFDGLLAGAGADRRVIALDWRSHGESEHDDRDFGAGELLEDALAVIAVSGAERVVPVAQAHAGWVAIELARQLRERVPAIALTSWTMFSPPPQLAEMLAGLQDKQDWAAARDKLVGMWLGGGPTPVVDVMRAMTARYGSDMWARAAREIASAFSCEGTATKALASLATPPPTLHVYAQPSAPEYLAAHETFACEHGWFHFRRVEGATHFPTVEVPDAVLAAIDALPGARKR